MNAFRIALANLRFPPTAEESIAAATQAIRDAGRAEAGIVCFPECFVPGYRGLGTTVEPSNPVFLERAWSAIAQAAAEARITVILGTERFVDGALTAREMCSRDQTSKSATPYPS